MSSGEEWGKSVVGATQGLVQGAGSSLLTSAPRTMPSPVKDDHDDFKDITDEELAEVTVGEGGGVEGGMAE